MARRQPSVRELLDHIPGVRERIDPNYLHDLYEDEAVDPVIKWSDPLHDPDSYRFLHRLADRHAPVEIKTPSTD